MSNRKSSKAEKVHSRQRNLRRGSASLPKEFSRAATVSRHTSRRTPQVVVRAGREALNTSKPKYKKRPAPRRRYDVSLSAQGAEIRLPALPVIQNPWQIFSGLLSAALTILLIYLWNSPTFQVSQVEVQGLERFTAQEISRAIDVEGKPSFSLIPSLLQADLAHTYPGLETVQVRVDWPAGVVVSVGERHPLVAWNWNGEESWVDASGVDFNPRGESEGLIQVQAFTPPERYNEQFASPKLIQAVTTLASYAPSDASVIYDEKYGLGWQDPRGWQVYFGFDTVDLPVKQLIYNAIVKRLEEQGIRPALISVEYVNAPYYRMER